MITDDNYYIIQGWMLNRLELKGVALNVYAVIYGFSQDGESVYSGGRKYLADFVGVSKPTIDNALNSLLEKGYILKIKKVVNGVTFYDYKADLSILLVVKNLYQGSKETLPHNKIYNKEKENILKENAFSDEQEQEQTAVTQPTDTYADAKNEQVHNSEPNQPTIVEQDTDCLEIFNYWNSKGIIKHSCMTEKISKAIKKTLILYSKYEIKCLIDRYSQILGEKEYYFKYKWSLVEFLTRKGGANEFSDSGSKWVNYQQWLETRYKQSDIRNSPKRRLNLI